MSWFPPVWNLTVYAYVRACLHTQSHRPVSSMNAVVVVVVVVSLDDSSSIYSKSEGYADDFSTKSEHCNRIHVNGIYAQGNSEELFPLAMKKKEMKKWKNEEMKKEEMKKAMTYCGKCIYLCSKNTPSNYCSYWKSFYIVNWATSIQEGRIIGTVVIWSSGRFSDRQLECVPLTDLHSKTPSCIINNLLHGKSCNTARHFY